MTDTTAATTSQYAKSQTCNVFCPPAVEERSDVKMTVDESCGKDDSQKASGDQGATAQDTKSSSTSTARPTQDAPASSKDPKDVSEKGSTQTWIARLAKAGHDFLWPSDPTQATGPTLKTRRSEVRPEHFGSDTSIFLHFGGVFQHPK